MYVFFTEKKSTKEFKYFCGDNKMYYDINYEKMIIHYAKTISFPPTHIRSDPDRSQKIKLGDIYYYALYSDIEYKIEDEYIYGVKFATKTGYRYIITIMLFNSANSRDEVFTFLYKIDKDLRYIPTDLDKDVFILTKSSINPNTDFTYKYFTNDFIELKFNYEPLSIISLHSHDQLSSILLRGRPPKIIEITKLDKMEFIKDIKFYLKVNVPTDNFYIIHCKTDEFQNIIVLTTDYKKYHYIDTIQDSISDPDKPNVIHIPFLKDNKTFKYKSKDYEIMYIQITSVGFFNKPPGSIFSVL